MNKHVMTDEQTFLMLDRVYHSKGSLPHYRDCQARGYRGGTAEFNARRSMWARDRGVEMVAVNVDDTEVKKLAAIERATSKSLPTPEVDRGKYGRPYNPEQPNPIEESVKAYRQSWRRISGDNIIIEGREFDS